MHAYVHRQCYKNIHFLPTSVDSQNTKIIIFVLNIYTMFSTTKAILILSTNYNERFYRFLHNVIVYVIHRLSQQCQSCSFSVTLVNDIPQYAGQMGASSAHQTPQTVYLPLRTGQSSIRSQIWGSCHVL